MRSRMRRGRAPSPSSGGSRRLPYFSLLVAGVAGALVLLDAFVSAPAVDILGAWLLEYAQIVAAFALVLGLLHLVRVHARRIIRRPDGWPNSLFLLVVTLFFTAAGLVEGPNGTLTQWSVSTLLLPLQAAFFSLLAFFLAGALIQTARARSFEGLLLVSAALLVVVAGTPLAHAFAPWLVTMRAWLMESVATAGARAVLLGVALGTVVTAFRFLADGRRLFS